MATPMSLQPCFQISVYDDVVYAQTWEVLGTLRSDDGDDNENVKKAIGLIAKPTILHVHHALLYISFPSLHDHDVKMPNRCKEGEHKRLRNFPPLSELGYGS